MGGGGSIHEKNQIYLVAKFHWFIFFPKEVKVNVSMISEQPSYVRNVAAVDDRLSSPFKRFPPLSKTEVHVHVNMFNMICPRLFLQVSILLNRLKLCYRHRRDKNWLSTRQFTLMTFTKTCMWCWHGYNMRSDSQILNQLLVVFFFLMNKCKNVW